MPPDSRGGRASTASGSFLSALEDEAVRLKVTRIVLETGIRQHEALTLYERTGFRRIPAFGEYIGSPLSICMEKRI